jgi:hypothetical protein
MTHVRNRKCGGIAVDPSNRLKETQMSAIRRLLALFTGGLMLASVVGLFAARAAKERIEAVDAPDADEIRLAAIFEPMSFRSTATRFRGGTVDCWYGGGVIDLREAILDPGGARLDVRAVFGGAQIVVPATWRVDSKVVGIGGVGDGRPPVEDEAEAPHLTIEGLAIFGGFGVTSELPEAAAAGLEDAVARSRARRVAVVTPEVVPATLI